jgi:nucleotide-binding universal stress UspA family protein
VPDAEAPQSLRRILVATDRSAGATHAVGRATEMAETIGALSDGSYVAPDPLTLGERIERWLVTMAPKVRSSTVQLAARAPRDSGLSGCTDPGRSTSPSR